MKDIRTHQRVIDTFTGPWERPVLRWLASQQASWVTPDLLTTIGVLGSLITFAGYALTFLNRNFLWLASFGFVVNWYGDSLDGTLARYRKIERPLYGFYIDHVVDVFNEILIILGLGLSPYVRFDLACLCLIGYLALSVLVYVRMCVRGEFTISYGKLGPTEARLIAMGANTLIWIVGNPAIQLFSLTLTLYDWIAIGVIFLLLIIIISTAARQAKLLSKLDPGKNRSV